MDEQQTTSAVDRLGERIDAPAPPIDSLVSMGTALLRRRRRWRVVVAAATVALVVGTTAVVTAVAGDGPRQTDAAAVPGSRVVTASDQVAGDWYLVRVEEAPPPADAVRRISISRTGPAHRFSFGWSDTVN